MTTNTWHVGPELLSRYASGALDLAVQASVEEHMTACSACRHDAAEKAPQSSLDEVWHGVVSVTSAPRLPLVLRLASRIGLPETDAVILRTSSSLHRPWLLSLSGALLFAAVGSLLTAQDQRTFYLLLAPLLPAVTVAAAYDSTDPMRDLTSSTPFSKLRIALLRTAAAVGFALPIVLGIGVLLPFVGAQAFAWLLPAIALTLLALILLTWCRAPLTAAVVAGVWVTFVAALRAGNDLAVATTPFAQAGFAVVCLLALTVLAIRLISFRAPGGYA